MNIARLVVLLPLALAGCQKPADPASAAAPSQAAQALPFKPTATIQDLMKHEVDPSADSLWESVSTIVTAAGVEEHQPRTDEEWHAVRHHAIVLMEAGNLLMMDGRRIAAPGMKLEDEGIQGILTAAEAQHTIDANRAGFVGFASALHDVGAQMLKAIDEKNPQGDRKSVV